MLDGSNNKTMNSRTATILIVEYEQDAWKSLHARLNDEGYQVERRCGLPDKFERTNKAYDVAIFDLSLRGISAGVELQGLDAVRECSPNARTIIIVEQRPEHEQIVQRLLRDSADAVCYRPVDLAQLLDIVRQLAIGDQPQAT